MRNVNVLESSNKVMNKAKKWAQDHKVELIKKWEDINE
jgi:hypothetical protein